MISFDAETVTGGATESVGDGGGAAVSKTDGISGETSSTFVVTLGSLGCANFSFSFNWRLAWRLAAFCARAIAFWRCFICFCT